MDVDISAVPYSSGNLAAYGTVPYSSGNLAAYGTVPYSSGNLAAYGAYQAVIHYVF